MDHSSDNIYSSISQLRRMQFQAHGFDFTPKQPVNSLLSGKYVSKLRGRGLNFEELRHYRPGDDIRSMDWKVTKRLGKPHIKVFTEERERNVYLFIDQRSNMFFGSQGKMKSVVAAEIAALIAWRVIDVGDRVGALVFNDRTCKVFTAKRGRAHVMMLLNEIIRQNHQLSADYESTNPSKSLNTMLSKIGSISKSNALIIPISDGAGWNDNTTDHVRKLRQHNELIAFQIMDPLEHDLPKMSQMVVSDGKLQIQFASDLSKTQSIFRQAVAEQQHIYENTMKKYRIPLINISTMDSVVNQLRKAFGRVVK